MERVSPVSQTLDIPTYHSLRQPGALVDVYDRLGAVYIGGPAERLDWERLIIRAGQELLQARQTLQHFSRPDESLFGGIQSTGPGGSVSLPRP